MLNIVDIKTIRIGGIMSKKFNSGVYFIKNNATNLVKIGYSKDVYQRFKNLQGTNEHLGYTSELIFLDCILCENYIDLEKKIHNQLTEVRVINEWFRITEDDVRDVVERFSDDHIICFSSGVINTDTNTSKAFIEKGLTYVDIGILFVLKDYIDSNNRLSVDDKPISQKDLIGITKLSRASVSNKMRMFDKLNIIRVVKECGANTHIFNPSYFRLNNNTIDEATYKLFDINAIDKIKIQTGGNVN